MLKIVGQPSLTRYSTHMILLLQAKLGWVKRMQILNFKYQDTQDPIVWTAQDRKEEA